VNERERRIGQNEVLYREVNERVNDLNDQFELTDELATFVCECGRLDCSEPMRMTGSEYARVRSDPATFAVKPGHEFPDVEVVVEEHEEYDVVRKREGGPAELARDEATG
jgi:hypothetical protein